MLDAINCSAYVVVNALGGRRAGLEDVVVVAMIDQQDAARLQALLEVLDRALVLSLIAAGVHQVSEGVAQADDGIEAGLNLILDIVVQRQPVGLLDGCERECELQLAQHVLLPDVLTPVVERVLLAAVPALLESVLQHFV